MLRRAASSLVLCFLTTSCESKSQLLSPHVKLPCDCAEFKQAHFLFACRQGLVEELAVISIIPVTDPLQVRALRIGRIASHL